MAMPRFQLQPGRLWLYSLSLVAGAVGGWWCFGFGRQISGLLLAWVLALNGGVFAALVTASVLDRLARWARPSTENAEPTSPESGSARTEP
jgi:zinc transporter ZupT